MHAKIWSLLIVVMLLFAGIAAQAASAEVDPNSPPESVYREGIENGLHPAEVRYQWRLDPVSYTHLGRAAAARLSHRLCASVHGRGNAL